MLWYSVNLVCPALGITVRIRYIDCPFMMVALIWFFLRYWSDTKVYLQHQSMGLFPNYHPSMFIWGFLPVFKGFLKWEFFRYGLVGGTLGAISQAANQIAQQMVSMTFMVFIGFGVAATVRVGNQKGRKNFVEMKRIAKSIFLQVFLFELLFTFILIAFRNQLPWIYLSKDYTELQKLAEVQAVYEQAVQLLIVAGLFQISDGFQVVLQGALRGLQDVIYPFFITLVAYWLIGFPISWYAGKTYGTLGIWYGLLTGLTVAAILLFWRFKYLSHKLIHY